VNNHAHVLDGADIDHLRYLSLFINATDLVPYVTGTAQPKMNQAKMNMIPVALPPLAEQKRIVTKVDQLMALCDDLEAKQTKKRDNGARFTMASLDALLAAETSGAFDAAWKRVWKDFQLVVQRRSDVPSLRSAIVGLACGGWLSATARTREWGTGADLVEAILQSRRIERAKLLRNGVRPGALPRAEPVQFSEPASRPGLPPSWTLCGIDDLLACVPNAMKAGPFGSALTKSMYVPTGYKVYGQEQVISGDHRVGSYYVDRAKFESLRSCAVAPGDMLVSLMGTIGKVLILPNDCEPGIINPRLLKLSIHSSVSPDYIRLCLQSPQSQRFLMESARGVAMDGLNIGILRALPIALPPLPEQLWLLERVEILLKLLDDLEAKLRKQEETATHLAESLAAAVAG
jgi:type I restriction enzyme S subunit